jgi:hypothetical protein
MTDTDTLHMHPTDQYPFLWGHYDRYTNIADAVRTLLDVATSRNYIASDFQGEIVITVKREPEQITVQLWQAYK